MVPYTRTSPQRNTHVHVNARIYITHKYAHTLHQTKHPGMHTCARKCTHMHAHAHSFTDAFMYTSTHTHARTPMPACTHACMPHACSQMSTPTHAHCTHASCTPAHTLKITRLRSTASHNVWLTLSNTCNNKPSGSHSNTLQ